MNIEKYHDNMPWEHRVAMGYVSGVKTLLVNGRNRDVDLATDPETIWEYGGVYAFPSAATAMEIISSSANDVAGTGTGAWAIYILGLDINYQQIFEVVYLNGTAAVPCVNLYYRINEMFVVAAGTGSVNVGNISLRAQSGGTVYGYIGLSNGSGTNRQFSAIYTVPAGHTFLMRNGYANRTVSAAGNVDVMFVARPIGYARQSLFYINAHSYDAFIYDFSFIEPIREKTDLWVAADMTSADNSDISAGFSGLLINGAEA